MCPIEPAVTGNGLAMRVGLFLRGLASRFDLTVVIVPIAGSRPSRGAGGDRLLALASAVIDLGLPDAGAYDRSLRQSLLDPAQRPRMVRATPLPAAVEAALPGRAAELDVFLGEGAIALVHAMRASLLPLGSALAQRLGATLTVDLDDDDVGLADALGETETARLWTELLGAWLGAASLATLASPEETSRVAARWPNLTTFVTVPNAVTVPRGAVARSPADRNEPADRATDKPEVLIVANLTYRPNAEGLSWFAREVVPRMRAAAVVRVIGPHAPDLAVELALLPSSPVPIVLTGFVAESELNDAYQRAAVVAAPVLAGGGTRTKVLEAFARNRPIVATTPAAAGLDVVAGTHLLVADAGPTFAAALDLLLTDEAERHRISAAAYGWVLAYDVPLVAATLGQLFADAPTVGRRNPAECHKPWSQP